MCGISGIFGSGWKAEQLEHMVSVQYHRGPDAHGTYLSPSGFAALGHNRLSIIDLSPAGRQPMSSDNGRYWVVFNGEIYNFLELRMELSEYSFRTKTDTEVIFAAYERWGEACVDHFIGMFAFLLWDDQQQTLFAARDRFGVKPLYYHFDPTGTLRIASEIKSLHAGGVARDFHSSTWASYLTYGIYDHSEETFWTGIRSLPAGHYLKWHDHQMHTGRWYDLYDRVGDEVDSRDEGDVQMEYLSLLEDSIRLRFRADVPVGINLSGGLDSSTLLAIVQRVQGSESRVKAFTFVTENPEYDETLWVQAMLAQTQHPSILCPLRPQDVPERARSVQASQDEPFGGLPTLAYAGVFEEARAQGVIVLLDGQGLDEQWAGYDYYAAALKGGQPTTVQGVKESPVRPECLTLDLRNLAQPLLAISQFEDRLRSVQYRDAHYTKIPRALRFNDRVSMRASTELREPFLDHRLFELAFRQPPSRKIRDGVHKWTLRKITADILPAEVTLAPKRPLQTPQREWLRGPLQSWADELIHCALETHPDWFKRSEVERVWVDYCAGRSDNSFYIWQWVNLGLMVTV